MASRGEQRRESRKSGGSDMTKFYWVLGAVAVIGVASVGYSVGSGAMGSAVAEPVDIGGLENMETLVELAQGVTKGDPSAAITIVEFADYACPGCAAFALSVKPQVELAYISSGKAKFVYYDFPLAIPGHHNAFLAARAARCAGDQDLYWQYQDVLFRNQSMWAPDTNAEATGEFIDYAEDTGADTDAFEACLKSDRYADVVTANMRLAEQLNINGTPTILISQGQGMARRLANFDFQSIESVVEEMLAPSENPGD